MSEDEYNHCVEKHADNVYRFILKNIKNEDKASDIVQDAYEKMWRHRSGINPEKAKSYLFTTAYHVLVDAIRKEKNQISIEQANLSAYYGESNYTDLGEILHRAIDQLPATQKMVLMLRDYEGYSYEEIEQITNLSESQVKVYIYRARVFLKNLIGKMEVVI